MKKITIALVLALIATQAVKAQNDTLRIQTSAVCGTCKETIENDLSFVKGIISSNLVVKTKELTVVYDSKKIDANKIRIEVTKIGYDADSLKADPKAFKHLPDCCKKPHNE
jgi:copper chaperone CopZ